ncbi:c-type cytochrome [Gemmatimonadota bacterium]
MNYPVWDIPFLGSAGVVAVIAVIHVLIAHVAIGGGAFLFIAEKWSDRQANGDAIRTWLRKYATWFLVYTTVIGAVTGVGIWFSIQLASPEGTSLLIHQFVFAWAIEWVMFLGELTVLYLYFYGWEKNSRQMQVFLAGAYFVIAWGSLFVINGILTFMLTPGTWSLENTSIFAGFFNPGYFPSLLIRTLIMFMLGGLFGIIVATRVSGDDGFRDRIIRFSVKWVLPAALIIPFLLLWYWSTLPQNTLDLFREGATGVFGGRLEALNRYFWLAMISGFFIVIGAAVIAIRPKAATTAGAVALFLVAQFGFMGAEFFREMSRKPYVIYDVLYSNSLWKQNSTDQAFMGQPYLSKADWHPEVVPQSLEHGEWVFRLQCVSCHTWGAYRSLRARTEEWTEEFGARWMETMHESGVMPPFQGTAEDREALSNWIVTRHGEVVEALESAETVEGGGR